MHEKPLILTGTPPALLEALDTRAKLVCLAVWAGCVVTVPAGAFVLVGAYAALLAALLIANHHLVGGFLKRLAPALPAIVVLCLLLPLCKEGHVAWRWGILSVSREGLYTAARVGSAAILCVGGVALVWASTGHEALLVGLRGVGLPAVMVGVLAFMLRYLEVLRPELHRLTDARAARTLGRGGPGPLRSGANVLGTLFIRAHDRAERVADAMVARGYTGELRRYQHSHLHRTDIVAGFIFVAVVVALRIMLGGRP
ncbi:MAG: energy-coupling factor transporter transmembrane component T [Phycisphaerae bacterium]